MGILIDDLMEARDRLRYAMTRMEEAKVKWERRKAALTSYVDQNSHNFNETTRRRKFQEDYGLSDAMDAYNFWGKEVARWSAAILAEKAVAELAASGRGGFPA